MSCSAGSVYDVDFFRYGYYTADYCATWIEQEGFTVSHRVVGVALVELGPLYHLMYCRSVHVSLLIEFL